MYVEKRRIESEERNTIGRDCGIETTFFQWISTRLDLESGGSFFSFSFMNKEIKERPSDEFLPFSRFPKSFDIIRGYFRNRHR